MTNLKGIINNQLFGGKLKFRSETMEEETQDTLTDTPSEEIAVGAEAVAPEVIAAEEGLSPSEVVSE